jgi:hypothetical protein
VKTPIEVTREVERRLTRTWAATLTASRHTTHLASRTAVGHDQPRPWADGVTGPPALPEQDCLGPTDRASGPGRPPEGWRPLFPLGQPDGAELDRNWAAYHALVALWRDWLVAHAPLGVRLLWRDRRVKGTSQQLPSSVVVPDVTAAAHLSGPAWVAKLDRGRRHADLLAASYPHLRQPARVLVEMAKMSDLDIELLQRAAAYFAQHPPIGTPTMTPRQVPVEGLHAKWLNTRQHLVRDLAGLDPAGGLGLLPDHPARIHFTYLDPAHLASGGRRHDSATVGDRDALAYRPDVVIISENKDTAIHFPDLPGGIAVEGDGAGGGTAAAFRWVTGAPRIFYWGDMDAAGLEILDGFRAAGVPAESLLMDPAAYETWEQYGTGHDKAGKPLESRPARTLPHLTNDEAQLYARLTSPAWTRHRRIEQERIPLHVAVEEVRRRRGQGNSSRPRTEAG